MENKTRQRKLTYRTINTVEDEHKSGLERPCPKCADRQHCVSRPALHAAQA